MSLTRRGETSLSVAATLMQQKRSRRQSQDTMVCICGTGMSRDDPRRGILRECYALTHRDGWPTTGESRSAPR